MLDRLLAPLTPHSCYGCGEIGFVLCPSCIEDIVSDDFGRCGLCLKPVATARHLCGSCRLSSPLDELWCASWRVNTVRSLLDDYKFEAVRAAAQPLAELVHQRLPREMPTVYTTVPTAASHVRQLGYDHAEHVGRELARQRRGQFRRLLARNVDVVQHRSGRQQRWKQADQLFRPIGAMPAEVVLFDDVLTTGATLRAAAKTLRTAGAQRVYGVIIARQPLD